MTRTRQLLVEQSGLLDIENVAGHGEHREARRRDGLLQEQARLDTGVVLVAGDDGARVVIRRWQAFNAAFCLPFDHAESVIVT